MYCERLQQTAESSSVFASGCNVEPETESLVALLNLDRWWRCCDSIYIEGVQTDGFKKSDIIQNDSRQKSGRYGVCIEVSSRSCR